MKTERLKESDFNEHFVIKDIFSFDICSDIEVHSFDAGEDILMENERPFWLYYLVKGRAKLYLTHDNGRITLINFLAAPCFIGEMELLDENKRSDGVKAITECVCFAIPVRQYKDKLLQDTKFLRYLCCFLSEKAIGNTANYSRNQAFPLRNRLASFILETSVNGIYREQHTEVAEYLGVTYRHLLYVISEFVQNGLLVKTNSGYLITDIKALRNISVK